MSVLKNIFKRAAYVLFTLLVLPIWILFLLESAILGTKKCFPGYSQLFSLIPGLIGNYSRFAFYRLTLASLGENTCICFGVTMSDPRACIGRNVYIGPFSNLGLCAIEDDVLLGTGVHVLSGFMQHGYSELGIAVREQKGQLLCVRIGADTWVGNKALIGNQVGEKCIIGAASMVNHEIPAYSIAVGNPAKVIRDRRQSTCTSSPEKDQSRCR